MKKFSDVDNKHRCDLIDKEIDGTLTESEAIELAELQTRMLKYRRMVAPLPIDEAKAALEHLKRCKQRCDY